MDAEEMSLYERLSLTEFIRPCKIVSLLNPSLHVSTGILILRVYDKDTSLKPFKLIEIYSLAQTSHRIDTKNDSLKRIK
jgi:hypothetical protein